MFNTSEDEGAYSVKLSSKEEEGKIVLRIFFSAFVCAIFAIGHVFYRAFSRHRKEAEGPGF